MTLIVLLAAWTVIVARALLLALLTDVAVKVTLRFAGNVAGAVYVTALLDAAESAPHVGAQLVPDCVSAQVTPSLAGSLATAAVNCCAVDKFSVALVGEIVTETSEVTVIVAVAFFVLFDTDVAVKVTVAGFGALPGALYVTGTPDALDVADKVPHALPLHPVPDSVQRTPRFLQSCRTRAVNDCVPPPACALALVGETLTVMRDCATLPGTTSNTPREERVIAAAMDFRPATRPR
jgi:hypothetical protein